MINLKFRNFIWLLTATDFLFIILSLISKFTPFNIDGLSVDFEKGTAEKYQYLKYFWTFLMILFIGFRKKSIIYILVSILPCYLLWDDSNSIHENIGGRLAMLFYNGSPNDILINSFRYQDIGEIIYMSLVLFLSLILFFVFFKLSDDYERNLLLKIKNLMIIFIFFSILMDGFHQLFIGFVYDLISIIEDGGEMVVISFLCAHFFEELSNHKFLVK